MKVLVDMCLPPLLAEGLVHAGHDAQHWSAVGDPLAMDKDIFAWAAENDHVLITHDLDFVDLLHVSQDSKPSVIVLRVAKTTAPDILPAVLRLLQDHESELLSGILVSMTLTMARFRRLPLGEGL